MIIKSLKILSQNVWKNKLLTDSIFENNKDYDIIFIQEPPWATIWQVPSTLSPKGENLIGTSYHLSWILFIRNSETENDYPRVTTYVNKKISKLQFSLWRDIYNHWDISLISFLNHGILYYLLNVYSDNQQNILKYLKDTEANLNNIIIITGNFNICDSDWDPVYLHHSLYTDTLCEISDSLDLKMSTPINSIPTQYADNTQDSNLVIDLMFLWPNHREFDWHQIILELCKLSDHASLVVSIAINEEHIHMKKQMITKDSKNEKEFIKQLGEQISNINISNIADKETLENITQ